MLKTSFKQHWGLKILAQKSITSMTTIIVSTASRCRRIDPVKRRIFHLGIFGHSSRRARPSSCTFSGGFLSRTHTKTELILYLLNWVQIRQNCWPVQNIDAILCKKLLDESSRVWTSIVVLEYQVLILTSTSEEQAVFKYLQN